MEDINIWHNKFKNCIYSTQLLSKLIYINKKIKKHKLDQKNYIDIKLIKKAIFYARKYHGDQKRKSGEPFYSHPVKVAYMVSDYYCNNEILVTSILHDTLEDTAITKNLLEIIFNNKIADNVEKLTRINCKNKISSMQMVQDLWSINRQDLLLIKYFDRLHNIQTINAKQPEKIYKTIKETLMQFVSLSLHLQGIIPGLYKQSKKLFKLCLKELDPKLDWHFESL